MIYAIVAFTGLSAAAVVAAISTYDKFFPRVELPDCNLTPGICCAERTNLVVERMPFVSDGTILQGYLYPCRDAKGLVVVCHGLRSVSDHYLAATEYFVGQGFAVFAFDGYGVGASRGESTVGMCQCLVDLDNALNFISATPRLAQLPLFLFGHSCGGYAAASVLSLHKEVRGCACISAPNNAFRLILQKGEFYFGKLAAIGLPRLFLDKYQKYLFGEYSNKDAVDSINSVEIPVLVAHGKHDKTINIDFQSVVGHRSRIRSGVRCVVIDGVVGGHDTVWHSDRAVKYAGEVDENIRRLKKKQAIKQYVSTVDHALYSEINHSLFSQITDTFNAALGIS